MPHVRFSPKIVFTITSLPFVLGLLYYYYTGEGGPILLAAIMVPYAFVLNSLDSLRQGELYPRLPRKLVHILLIVYGVLAAIVSGYIVHEFYNLITVRAGSYNVWDTIVGAIAFILVMEYARRRHLALFLLNLFLVFYALAGFVFPDPFWHPGVPLQRLITAMSVEFETGVFERLPQLALTTIGAFILFVSIAQGFGLVESMVRVVVWVMGRNPRLIPQAAVIGSMAVASVSGSGAANAATTGSITIPLMKRVGLPPQMAASIETAASIGGQLMPPIMGISAFIMADFLGVSYFEVMARGFAPALIYYATTAFAVYLIAARFLRVNRSRIINGGNVRVRPTSIDYIRVLGFLGLIALLIALMGLYMMPPMYAALLTALAAIIFATGLTVVESRGKSFISLYGGRLVETLNSFASFVSEITLLLSTLAIMTGIFTLTGLPTKIGFLMMDIGAHNVTLLAVIAFVFGYLVGLGMPPSATYVITALIIAPYLMEAGLEIWAIHFYAFFIGVFSELSPPTSVTAAVASRIAGASFTKTMVSATAVAIALIVLIASILAYPDLVMEPGVIQLLPAIIIASSSIGLTVTFWSNPYKNRAATLAARTGLGLLSLLTLSLRPLTGDEQLALLAALATLALALHLSYMTSRKG